MPAESKAFRRMPKAARPLYKAAIRAGWVVGITGRGHISWRNPSGHLVTTSSCSPGDVHAVRNLERDLRNGGLDIVLTGEKHKAKEVCHGS